MLSATEGSWSDITRDFNWTTHYTSICAKANKTLGLIRRVFKVTCTEAKISMYMEATTS